MVASLVTQSIDELEAQVRALAVLVDAGELAGIAPNGVTITNAAGDTLTIDGGQIDATNLNLSGHITFNDFSGRLQSDINGIEDTANDAYDLAEANKPPYYIKSNLAIFHLT